MMLLPRRASSAWRAPRWRGGASRGDKPPRWRGRHDAPVLKVRDIEKSYGGVKAVHGVSFEVMRARSSA